MVNAGGIQIDLAMNIARIQADVAKATGIINTGAKSMERSLASLKTALGAIGIGFGVGTIVAGFKSIINAADEVNKASAKFGISSESLSSMSFAAKLANVQFGDLEVGLKKLSVNAAAAAGGAKEQGRLFEAMGVKVRDAGGSLKATDALMREVADKFAGYNDGAGKAALATELFGKSGVNLIPLLNQMRQAEEEAKKLGAIFGKDLTQASEDFNDNITRLNAVLQAQKLILLNDVLPALNKYMTELIVASQVSGGFWKGLWASMTTDTRDPVGRLNEIRVSLENLKKQRTEFMQAGETTLAGRLFGTDSEVRATNAQIARLEKERDLLTKIAIANGQKDNFDLMGAPKTEAPVVKKIDREAAAELLKYENALRSLEDELGKLNNQTREERMLNDLSKGSLKGLTDEHGRHLVAVSKLIDVKRTQEAIDKSAAAGIEAEITRRDAMNESMASFHAANQTAIKDLAFEASVMNMRDAEREKAIALRRLELDYIAKLAAVSEIPGITAQTAAIAALDAARERARAAIVKGIDDRKTAEVLDQRVIENIRFETSLIGLNTVAREQAIAVRALEVTGVDRTTEAYRKYVEELKAAIAGRNAVERDWATGANGAFNEYIDNATNAAKQSRELFTHAFQSMEDALVEFSRTGKLDFKKLADSIISDIIRIQIRAQVLAPLAEAAKGQGGLIGALGKLLNFSGTPTVPTSFTPFGDQAVAASTAHTGGIAGMLPALRAVNAEHFYGAPRFHGGGLVGGEVPIVARRGEGVFTPEQMHAMQPADGEPSIVIDQSGWTFGSDVNQATLRAWGDQIERRTVRAVADNTRRGGSYRKAVRG